MESNKMAIEFACRRPEFWSVYSMCEREEELNKAIEASRLYTPEGGLHSYFDIMHRGSVNIVAAGTGVGKSWTMLQMAVWLAKKYRVLYLSLENDATEESVSRLFPILKNTFATDEQKLNIVYYGNDGNPISPLDDAMMHSGEFSEFFDFVFVDALEYLVSPAENESRDLVFKNKVNEIRNAYPNSCIWFSWQLNRGADLKDPQLANIANSYALAGVLTNAIALKAIDRKSGSEDNEIVILKKRYGAYPDTPMYLNKLYGFRPHVVDAINKLEELDEESN